MVIEQSRRFDDAYSAWRDSRIRGKRKASALEYLLREYRKVWANGNEDGRITVLMFLGHARPPGSDDIVWASLRSENARVVSHGLATALRYVFRGHARPDAAAVSTLVRLVKDNPFEGGRFMALYILGLAKVEGLDSWLQELAEKDPSAEIRREANIILMRKGSLRAMAALMADLAEHPDHFGVADRVWRHRHALELTEREDRELRQTISRFVDSLRRRLHDRRENVNGRSMAVSMLGNYARDGFSFEEEDVDAVGRIASSARRTEDRIHAVETLAAFDTPLARRWLQDIASGKRPKKVVEHARGVLGRRGD